MCPSHESEDAHKRKEQKRNPFLTTLKVLLKVFFPLSNCYKIFTVVGYGLKFVKM